MCFNLCRNVRYNTLFFGYNSYCLLKDTKQFSESYAEVLINMMTALVKVSHVCKDLIFDCVREIIYGKKHRFKKHRVAIFV